MEQRRNASVGKREAPEKIRRPVASSCTTPTCGNPLATPPGIEPGWPWWEASSLTTTSPRPHPVAAEEEMTFTRCFCTTSNKSFFPPESVWAFVNALFTACSRLRSRSILLVTARDIDFYMACAIDNPITQLMKIAVYRSSKYTVSKKGNIKSNAKDFYCLELFWETTVLKAKIRIAGPGSKPGSSRMRDRRFTTVQRHSANFRSRSEGAIRARVTRTPSGSSLLRERQTRIRAINYFTEYVSVRPPLVCGNLWTWRQERELRQTSVTPCWRGHSDYVLRLQKYIDALGGGLLFRCHFDVTFGPYECAVDASSGAIRESCTRPSSTNYEEELNMAPPGIADVTLPPTPPPRPSSECDPRLPTIVKCTTSHPTLHTTPSDLLRLHNANDRLRPTPSQNRPLSRVCVFSRDKDCLPACLTNSLPSRDLDMHINPFIASTRKALNWRAVLPSLTRLYETFSCDPTISRLDNKNKDTMDGFIIKPPPAGAQHAVRWPTQAAQCAVERLLQNQSSNSVTQHLIISISISIEFHFDGVVRVRSVTFFKCAGMGQGLSIAFFNDYLAIFDDHWKTMEVHRLSNQVTPQQRENMLVCIEQHQCLDKGRSTGRQDANGKAVTDPPRAYELKCFGVQLVLKSSREKHLPPTISIKTSALRTCTLQQAAASGGVIQAEKEVTPASDRHRSLSQGPRAEFARETPCRPQRGAPGARESL
ncbi:hypothetical protein PR048_006678 [Dryococelus australis]|uniref:Uncharacterized protein n=1 Tax=Dryococelus australis TaxID=614101 RepID=A0ABQ9IDU5_9NEOP|nr:hypothetical protein PR048_006678 [Dryococelus australis]